MSQDLEEELTLARKRVSDLEALKKEVENYPKDQQLAVYLHGQECRFSHRDGTYSGNCPWKQENPTIAENWSGPTHLTYLHEAQGLLTLTDDLDLIKKVVAAKANNKSLLEFVLKYKTG